MKIKEVIDLRILGVNIKKEIGIPNEMFETYEPLSIIRLVMIGNSTLHYACHALINVD